MKYPFDTAPDQRQTGSIRWTQPEGHSDVLGMGTADLDFECPPCVKEALLKVAQENVYNYRYKPDSYFDAIIGFYDRKFSMHVEKEWLNNIPCTLGCIRLMLQEFAKPGDYVLMQTPYFDPLKNCIEGAGCRFLDNPMKLVGDRYELDFEDFEKKVQQYHPNVYLMVNPQNPTGRVFTREELERMVDICYRYHVLILSDEVHDLIVYDGHHHIPILAVSEKAREISMMVFSVSKGFNMMSLTHAMTMIANPELQKRWLNFLFSFDFHYASNAFSIAGVTAAMQPEADDWLCECNEYLKHNRDLFLQLVQEKKLPIKPIVPEASFLYWIDCRESGLDPEKIDQIFLDEAGIALNNGLGHGKDGRGFVRLNFGVTEKVLREAVDRMEKMFRAQY